MVYISKLNKDIFPRFLKPEKDELFTSWLCRLSINHEVKTNTFISNYFGSGFPFWNRDIDVSAPESILKYIKNHTPLSKEEVEQMFLKKYDGFAYDIFRTTGSISNILPLGINHRKRKKFGQQCCTSCLTKCVPYYKCSWRLISSVVCLECNQILIDRCFLCDSPITFFRINIKTRSNLSTMNFQPIFLCSNCGTDLRRYTPNRLPTQKEIEYQVYVNKTIEDGYNNLTQYSFTFFRVLFILALRLKSKAKNNRFRDIIVKNMSIPNDFIDKELRYWSNKQRLETFPLIYDLLKDLEVLKELFREGKVIKNYLVKDTIYIPYWFEKLLIY